MNELPEHDKRAKKEVEYDNFMLCMRSTLPIGSEQRERYEKYFKKFHAFIQEKYGRVSNVPASMDFVNIWNECFVGTREEVKKRNIEIFKKQEIEKNKLLWKIAELVFGEENTKEIQGILYDYTLTEEEKKDALKRLKQDILSGFVNDLRSS